jgi:hypothetical protein
VVCVCVWGVWSVDFLDQREWGRGRQWTDAGKETELAVEQVALSECMGVVRKIYDLT